MRITVRGKRRDIGLGSARDVSLAEARDLATDIRRAARAGRDPLAARREARGDVVTFAQAAEIVHAQRLGAWSNGKHQDQWITTLRTYAFPHIGNMPVGDIQSGDVLRVLSPIWSTKPETARRVRQRIHAVLEWAVAANHRSPQLVNAADAVKGGLPRQSRKVRHQPSVAWREVPVVIHQIRETPSAPAIRLALEFLVLTAGRTSEVLGARWSEVDLDAALWTVPADRMKARQDHRVPLAPRALEILTEARALWPESSLVFPGQRRGAPLSNMALLMLMRRLGCEAVPHGFRSSFRDWAADTGQNRDLAEAALAHTLASKVEAAYRRTDLLELRRPLMNSWAAHVTGSGE